MLKFAKQDGLSYVDEKSGGEYSLFGTKCIGANAVPDIVVIFDNERQKVVNYFYGESVMFDGENALQELDNTIAYYVGEYLKEEKENGTC